MSDVILSYEHKIAHRNHKRSCEMTGLPIKKGDRFFVGCGIFEGRFWRIKAHSIIQEMAVDESLGYRPDEGWDPWKASTYLHLWLEKHLEEDTWRDDGCGFERWVMAPEVQACYDAALAYWKLNRFQETA